MAHTLHLTSEYVVVRCGAAGCGQAFGMARWFYDQTQETGATWYCPSGHPRAWKGETTRTKLERAEARERHLEDQLRASEAAAEVVRARLVRDRQRFANGVCPCCNRSFENVARHMKTEHPDYDPAELKAHPKPVFRCSCSRTFDTAHGLKVHQGRSRPDDWQSPKIPKWRRHLTEVG